MGKTRGHVLRIGQIAQELNGSHESLYKLSDLGYGS